MTAILGWVEIAAGLVSFLLVGWFFTELLRGRISLQRLRESDWL